MLTGRSGRMIMYKVFSDQSSLMFVPREHSGPQSVARKRMIGLEGGRIACKGFRYFLHRMLRWE